MAQVWYDQTATVDGVKGNNRGSTTVEHWYKAMVGDYSDRLRRRTDGRGISVAICIDGVAMRRARV
jgi:hypothetical protein